jgi:hypothetical protein
MRSEVSRIVREMRVQRQYSLDETLNHKWNGPCNFGVAVALSYASSLTSAALTEA